MVLKGFRVLSKKIKFSQRLKSFLCVIMVIRGQNTIFESELSVKTLYELCYSNLNVFRHNSTVVMFTALI